MRIIFVGDLNEHTRCFQRLRALRELGHIVTAIPSVPIGRVSGVRGDDSLLFRVSAKLGHPFDRTGANRQLCSLATTEKPDLVWIEKGVTIRASTLAFVKYRCPHTIIASYSEDDMFSTHNRSRFYTSSLPNYDIVFTTKSYNANPDELPSLGAVRVVFVDKAYDIYTHRPIILTPEERAFYAADIGFTGNFESDRADKLALLARHGFQVRVWGNGWASMRDTIPNLKIEGRPIYGDGYVKSICSTKINMCFLRKQNRDLQTDRTMEIPACGGFMLAERTGEHLRLFSEDVEVAFFGSDREMLERAAYYLEKNHERECVARAGRNRCVESGYSHHERLTFMLDIIDDVREAKSCFQCIRV